MFHAVRHEVSNNQASRVVTLADVEWLVSPASQEIPLSFADCLRHTPAARSKPQLHEAQSSAASVQNCKQLQSNASVEDSADDSDAWDAPSLRVTNVFQHLMKKSKSLKSTKKEQSSNAVVKKQSFRNVCIEPTPRGKRQRQPSIDQFLPSNDLVGVWMPATSSKRANLTAATRLLPDPSIHTARVTLVRERCPLSPPNEPPASQQPHEHFSLTLSLGSNTEDESSIDHEHEPQYAQLLQHQQHPYQQLPFVSLHQDKRPSENLLPEPDASAAVICSAALVPDGQLASAGALLPASSTSATGFHASPSLFSLPSPPSSFGAMSPIFSVSSFNMSSNFAQKSHVCSSQLSCAQNNQSEVSQPQLTKVAPLLPHLASPQVVLESVVVHGTLSDTAVFQPSLPQVHSMTCSPVEPTFHKQLKVTAETLLPEDSSSSNRFLY